MRYPVYIHSDGAGFGVTIPDVPGCFTAGDTADEALANVQEAVEAHLIDEPEIPAPSPLSRWLNDPEFSGGAWALAEVDVERLRAKSVRVNITLPERVLNDIDAAARARDTSRSGLIAQAARELIARDKRRRPA
jgi:predicted RNase H-like HicB family nuclease